MNKILIVEDDILFAQTLQDVLEDFECYIAKDANEALNLSFEINFDLYLLDINLPKINGIELLELLKNANPQTPAMMITSHTSLEMVQKSFGFGCDDYVKKSMVEIDEMIIRIKSLLKRSGKQQLLHVGDDLTFCQITKRVFKGEIDLQLPEKVILLLELFLQNKDKIITKSMIISKLWPPNQEHSEGSIRVYINSIKKLLNKDCITNIKGVGYKFEE